MEFRRVLFRSATIVCAVKAASLVSHGQVFYAMFEQTYEANCRPHTPHWSARFFGTAEECMQRVVRVSSDTEGGCLKWAGRGDITPSAYIKRWRKAFAAAVEMPRLTARLKFGDGIYKHPEDERPAVLAVLARHGLVFDSSARAISFPVPDHPAAVAELVMDYGVYLWRLIDATAASWHQPGAPYAPTPPTSAPDALPVRVFSITADQHEPEHWVVSCDANAGEAVAKTGWAYSTVQHLISRFAVAAEAASPGSAEQVIRQIRQVVGNRTEMARSQPVFVSLQDAKVDWERRAFGHFATKLQRECSQISTTVGEIIGSGALYELTCMSPAMVKFPGLRNVMQPCEQLALAE